MQNDTEIYTVNVSDASTLSGAYGGRTSPGRSTWSLNYAVGSRLAVAAEAYAIRAEGRGRTTRYPV